MIKLTEIEIRFTDTGRLEFDEFVQLLAKLMN